MPSLTQDLRPRPSLIVFDVNETLSDLTPMGEWLAELGAPAHLAPTWFASTLRDGFALTVTGANPAFAEVARATMITTLTGVVDDPAAVADAVLPRFSQLPLHPDVAPGLEALRAAGLRLVTLSNGSTAVAQSLLERAGLLGEFETLLSAEQAPRWKPAPQAYAYALQECGIVGPAEAMLVAVHPWDLHGAAGAGMTTAWINRGGRDYPTTFAHPDLTVTTLTELASRLVE